MFLINKIRKSNRISIESFNAFLVIFALMLRRVLALGAIKLQMKLHAAKNNDRFVEIVGAVPVLF